MPQKIILLGLGNLLCGDDGFGVKVVQDLQKKYSFPDNCEVIDGGTQGQILYGILEDADNLLIIDAVDFGLPPASLSLRDQNEIPVWLGSQKLSAHQSSFAEVLALGELKEILPEEICLLGFQTSDVEFGHPLSQEAIKKLPEAEHIALEWLFNRGICPRPEI